MGDTLASAPVVPEETIDVRGAPVAVRRRGQGRPLLFLHGAGFTGRWLRFHEALARHADVVAPEHIGFGATPMQEWLEGFDDLVLHYEDLRLALGLDQPFDLVGYSLGGWIAAEYAVFYPDRLRSLTLIAPPGIAVPGRPPRDLFAMPPADIYGVLFNDPANVSEVAIDPADLDTTVRMYEEMSTLARLVWTRRADRKLPRRLGRVTCPALVVGPEEDRFVPNEVSEAYASHLPGARVERVPGTGHALIVEQPEATAATISAFLEGLS